VENLTPADLYSHGQDPAVKYVPNGIFRFDARQRGSNIVAAAIETKAGKSGEMHPMLIS
jgi:hypothetical protein